MKVALSWLKKNAITVLLVVALILVLLLVILGFWFKVRGFKIADLFYKLQVLEAKNEIGHLEVKKAVLKEREDVAEEKVEELAAQIKEEEKKIEVARRNAKGMSSEDIAAELTDLGF